MTKSHFVKTDLVLEELKHVFDEARNSLSGDDPNDIEIGRRFLDELWIVVEMLVKDNVPQ